MGVRKGMKFKEVSSAHRRVQLHERHHPRQFVTVLRTLLLLAGCSLAAASCELTRQLSNSSNVTVTYDLSSLPLELKLSPTNTFSFDLRTGRCFRPNVSSHRVCQYRDQILPATAVQWGQGQCHRLGDYNGDWALLDPTDPHQGISISLTGGDACE